MRALTSLTLLSLSIVLVGCASHERMQSSRDGLDAADAAMPASASIAQATTDEAAAALVFDTPLTIGEPPTALAREDRQPGAFVGYQEQTITSFWIQIDVRQTGSPNCDRYERRAFIVQTGTTYR